MPYLTHIKLTKRLQKVNVNFLVGCFIKNLTQNKKTGSFLKLPVFLSDLNLLLLI